jgi:outer membrane protein OmpA-like peptidoglycan-associated protein
MFSFLLLGLAAHAAAPARPIGPPHGPTVSLGAGYIWMDPAESIGNAAAILPRVGYTIDRHWTVEAALGVMSGQTREGAEPYQVLTPRFDVLLVLAPDSPVQPFFVAGGGALRRDIRTPTGGVPIYAQSLPEPPPNPDADALLNVGYGMFFRIWGPWMLRGEFRALANIGTEPLGNTPDTFVQWEAAGALAFRGGELRRDVDIDGIYDRYDGCPKSAEDHDGHDDDDGCPDPDNDQDGIADEADDCPDEREDRDGFRDKDGCPDPDNDGDAVADTADACPDDPEDEDGWQDKDGCPEADNDGDGNPDATDRCPLNAEDRDEFNDNDGCPDQDNDADSIADFQDACPNQAEVFNGVEDTDGCPDDRPAPPPPPPKELAKFTGVIRGINFEVGSDEITTSSYPLLNEAAAVLLKYPQVRIEVQGHTDSDGADDANLDLSARRAKAVVTYLIARGVDPARLEWVGYGETKPLVPNTSKAQKGVNRRVEFNRLDTP